MAIPKALNEKLKKMWALDERLCSGKSISKSEKRFWNKNVRVVSGYYHDKNNYWRRKKIL